MKKYILSGLMGFGISVGCLLPPILHFVTGPLGPLIGGFFGGMRTQAQMHGAVIIGATIGICLTGFILLMATLVVTFQSSLGGFMGDILDKEVFTVASILQIALIPLLVGTILGTVGALLGGKMMKKEGREE